MRGRALLAVRALLGLRPRRPATRAALLAALLLAVYVALRINEQPGLAVSMYALIPILLAVSWFRLSGGLVTATAAMLAFLLDALLSATPSLDVSGLVLAAVNRAAVFYGVALLVHRLLRRERALTLRLRAQQEELSELESLREALTPRNVHQPPHLELATAFSPAEGVVAGDFFLAVDGPGGSTVVVVGDVVGHGVQAARSAAYVRAALATFARFTSDPVQLLQLANSALLEHPEVGGHFVTAVALAVGGPPEWSVRWAAAGHEPPWRLGTGQPLSGAGLGPPLGVQGEMTGLAAAGTSLRPGEGLLLFTDGLVEGRGARGGRGARLELFGEDRAREVVREHRDAPVAGVLEALVGAVTGFARGPLADDLCLVALRARVPGEVARAVPEVPARTRFGAVGSSEPCSPPAPDDPTPEPRPSRPAWRRRWPERSTSPP